MKMINLLFLFLFSYTIVKAQKSIPEFKKSVQIDVGFGKHGTGDLNGLTINSEYRRFFRNNFSLSLGLGATMHDGSFPILYQDANGSLIDASYRYTTGGIQLTSKFGISFLRINTSDFGLQAGAMVRYQSSSYFDELNVLYPGATGLSTAVIAIINKSPQRTVSAGGIGQLYYTYTMKNNVFIGLTGGMQIDTNGDFIHQTGISCGLRL